MFEAAVMISILGVSLGSFINACAYRIPRHISVVVTRSFCPSCSRSLSWFELIPVISFFAVGGSCRVCRNKISLQYPTVELVAGIATLLLFLEFGPTWHFVYVLLFTLIMLLVSIIDWQRMIIPNELVISGLIIGIGLKALLGIELAIMSFMVSLGAFVSMIVIRSSATWLFKTEAMGLGDVKLAAVTGLFLGFQGFLVALWSAAIVGLVFVGMRTFVLTRNGSVSNRSTFNETRLPFGSFLAFTSSFVLIFQDSINELVNQWLLWMQ